MTETHSADNYESMGRRYLAVRDAIAKLDAAHNQARAKLLVLLTTIEAWFTAKAQEDGLETVKTAAGTVYWSTHSSATVGSREALFAFCKQNDAWDLIESRASKTAVRSFIDAHGEPPPGVSFASVRVFNFRKSNATE